MTEQEAWEASGIEGFGMTMVPRREVWRLAWAAAKGEPEPDPDIDWDYYQGEF